MGEAVRDGEGFMRGKASAVRGGRIFHKHLLCVTNGTRFFAYTVSVHPETNLHFTSFILEMSKLKPRKIR